MEALRPNLCQLIITFMNFLELSGARLKDERERLGLNQEAFAGVGGVKRVAQYLYERGSRSPDSRYLHAVCQIGVDVGYVITGTRSSVLQSSVDSLLTAHEAVSAFKRTEENLKAGQQPSARLQLFKSFIETILEARQRPTGSSLSPQMASPRPSDTSDQGSRKLSLAKR